MSVAGFMRDIRIAAWGRRVYGRRSGLFTRVALVTVLFKHEMIDRRTGLLLLLLSALAAPVRAGELRQITLRDGSVISGEIESVQGGIYTLKSASLGTITLRDTEIRSIAAPSGAPARPEGAANASAPSTPQIDAVQRRILDDDAIMKSVTALQNDPQFQAVLNDPEITDALRAGDIGALERNPKVRSLMDDPRVQEINKKLAQ